MKNIIELQNERERGIRNRLHTIKDLVEGVQDKVRPTNKSAMVDVGNSQFDMMAEVGRYFVKVLKDNPSDGERAMKLIEQWSIQDRDGDNLNLTKNDFFPCVIRSEKESDFNLGQPPAVLTQHGMDKMLRAGVDGSSGVTSEDFESSFIHNVKKGDVILTVPGEKCVINKVELVLTPSGARSTDVKPPTDSDISYTESWINRWGEARRFTPFTLSSSYATWVDLFEKMDLSWEEAKSRGGFCLLVGCLYLSCEWACRNGTALKATSKSDDGFSSDILNAWINGSSVKIPQWMNKWRQPMQYTTTTLVDVGYEPLKTKGLMEWSRGELSKSIGGVIPAETRMPFVERSEGGFPLQDAALTTMGPLRFFLCFSLALETTGSSHLDDLSTGNDGFRTYLEGALTYLGKHPGQVGRKMDKVVVQMMRLITADLSMNIPDQLLVKQQLDDSPHDCNVQRNVRMYDRYAIAILAKNHDVPSDKLAIAKSISSKIPELEDGLMKIFTEFCGSDESVNKYNVSMYNTKVLDVITHLTHPGNMEGYSRSCHGSLPVKGYKSKTQRIVLEGINSSAPRLVDKYEDELFREIFDGFIPPDSKGMFENMWSLSNSRSGGADRIGFKVSPQTILDSELGGQFEEGFVSNRKDVMHFTAAFIMNVQSMMTRATPDMPFPLGLRSVAARVLRYIYNLPITQQIIMRPLYKHIKNFMAHSEDGYAIEQKIGVAVADMANELNGSIMLSQDPNLVCLAHDASALDQHIGPRHREVWRNVMKEVLVEFENDSLRDILGSDVKYADLVDNVLSSWDDAYFEFAVPQAPSQFLNVDTQPSGAITTGSDNTITTMAMLNMIQAETGDVPLLKQVWGDDCYFMMQMRGDDDIIEKVKQHEDLATEAGQVLGTIKDSTSGRVVHFLQKLFVGGQVVSRRMAYDHENAQNHERLPGMIGEYMDKARDMSMRGGNLVLLNMLQLMTIINGSRSTVFGRQAVTSFESMAAPGGTTNRLMFGFGQPNSKLYLELNFPKIFGDVTDMTVDAKAVLDTPKEIGKRVIDELTDNEAHVRLQLGGMEIKRPDGMSYTMNELQSSASQRLLKRDRRRRGRLTGKLTDSFTEADVLDHDYERAVIRGGYDAIGGMLREKRLNSKFKEKALVKNGFISRIADKSFQPEIKQIAVSQHRGIRIGDAVVTYSFNSTHILMLPNNSDEHFDLQSLDGTLTHRYKQYWHPFYSYPDNIRYLLSLTGVHAGQDRLKIKSHISKFSPSHFRKDLMPEHVMHGIDRVKKTGGKVREYLSFIGFTSTGDNNEIDDIMRHIHKMGLYRDLSDADEYSSVFDVAKSCSTQPIIDLISRTSPTFHALLSTVDSEVRGVVLTHYIGLLCDELNVACVQHRSSGNERNFIRIPIVSIDMTI
uniref:RdRp n=1 Tax=viral metagenome TaxID=1070528 RepID=A0A2V0RMM9_9ZZZZ